MNNNNDPLDADDENDDGGSRHHLADAVNAIHYDDAPIQPLTSHDLTHHHHDHDHDHHHHQQQQPQQPDGEVPSAAAAAAHDNEVTTNSSEIDATPDVDADPGGGGGDTGVTSSSTTTNHNNGTTANEEQKEQQPSSEEEPTLDAQQQQQEPSEKATEKEESLNRFVVDYASKSAGALILEKSKNFQGTSNLLNNDKDKYAITPCNNNENKFVIIGLSEDILVKQIKIYNYERFSSRMKDIEIWSSQAMETWTHLGTFHAKSMNGEQSFDLQEAAWARYLQFRFLSHYGGEHYCTMSQIKVHGSTMVQGLKETYDDSQIDDHDDGDVHHHDDGIHDNDESSGQQHVTAEQQQQQVSSSNDINVNDSGDDETKISSTVEATNIVDDAPKATATILEATEATKNDNGIIPADNSTSSDATSENSSNEKQESVQNSNGNDSNKESGKANKHHQQQQRQRQHGHNEGENEESLTNILTGRPRSGTAIDGILLHHHDEQDVELFASMYDLIPETLSILSAESRESPGRKNQSETLSLHQIGTAAFESIFLNSRVATDVANVAKRLWLMDDADVEPITVPKFDSTLSPVDIKDVHKITGGGDSNSAATNAQKECVDEETSGDAAAAAATTSPSTQEQVSPDNNNKDDIPQQKIADDAGRSEKSATVIIDQQQKQSEQRSEDAVETAAEQQQAAPSAGGMDASATAAATTTATTATATAHPDAALDEAAVPAQVVEIDSKLRALLVNSSPSASCLSTLNYQKVKATILAERKASSSPIINSNAAPGSPMEPIFKKLTKEIGTLQTNLRVQEEFQKLSNECYHKVLLEVVSELSMLRVGQEDRLRRLEERLERTYFDNVADMVRRYGPTMMNYLTTSLTFAVQLSKDISQTSLRAIQAGIKHAARSPYVPKARRWISQKWPAVVELFRAADEHIGTIDLAELGDGAAILHVFHFLLVLVVLRILMYFSWRGAPTAKRIKDTLKRVQLDPPATPIQQDRTRAIPMAQARRKSDNSSSSSLATTNPDENGTIPPGVPLLIAESVTSG